MRSHGPHWAMLKRVLLGIWADRRGQDILEYALLGAFIAFAAAATIAPVLNATVNSFDKVVSVIQVAVQGPGQQPAPQPPQDGPTVQSAK